MQSHLMVDTKGVLIKQIVRYLRKRSGQDRNLTPLAERARIAHHGETNPELYECNETKIG